MASVTGLSYKNDIISPELEQEIIQYLDKREWSTKLSRRTQHFGFEYDYKTKKAPLMTSPLEGPIKYIADYLSHYGIMTPNQCIVNEYTQKQGISAHTDSNIFGPTIVSISLLAPCEMIFTRDEIRTTKLTLMPRSILVLGGEARTTWKHEIKGTLKVSMPDGSTYVKPSDYRRISLTYRTV